MHAFDLSAVAGKTRGAFDSVDYVDGLPGLVEHPQATRVPHGAPVLASGWAIDPATDGPPVAVCVTLDGVRQLSARTHIARGDIMVEHDTDEFVGFQLRVDTGDLAPGPHELRAFALGSDGFWYEATAAGFELYNAAASSNVSAGRAIRFDVAAACRLHTRVSFEKGVPLRGNHWLLLQGWTFDAQLGRSAAAICAVDETGRRWSGASNLVRADVAQALHVANTLLGFEVVVPGAVFARGTHRLTLEAYDERGRRYTNDVEQIVDVVSPARTFPLAARMLSAKSPFGAQVQFWELADDDLSDRVVETRAHNDSIRKAKEPEPTVRELPATSPITASKKTQLFFQGWALDERGRGAEEVFIELTPKWTFVPPYRLAVECALRIPVIGMESDTDECDMWFRSLITVEELSAGAYDVALVVVQPGRRSFTHSPLAVIRVV